MRSPFVRDMCEDSHFGKTGRFEGIVTKLYDVQIILAAQKPMALGFQTEEIAQLITLEI